MDKLQVLQKLAADEKTSARIFKALADPPTTSLQRLKVINSVSVVVNPDIHSFINRVTLKNCCPFLNSVQYKIIALYAFMN